jgi:hypothetical protein
VRTPDEQLEFFRTKLGKTQPRQPLDLFRADLMRSNLDVMWAALKAAEAFVQRTKRAAPDSRQAVLHNYDVAAAAIAQMYPVFFVFESAWRTYVATRLDVIYGGRDWWHGVRDLVAQGADTSCVATLGTLPARPSVVRLLTQILSMIPRPSDLETTFELTEQATLKGLEGLIDHHWTDMSQPFTDTMSLGRTTSTQFLSLFKRVRDARNDAFHQRVVANRADVVKAAEQLVDLLNVHMGDRVAAIAGAKVAPLQFTVVREKRHG